MLTEKQLEVAAKKYCELLGIDPYEEVKHGPDSNGGFTFDILIRTVRWKRIADDLRLYDIRNEAINFAKNENNTIT